VHLAASGLHFPSLVLQAAVWHLAFSHVAVLFSAVCLHGEAQPVDPGLSLLTMVHGFFESGPSVTVPANETATNVAINNPPMLKSTFFIRINF
jgi:hypothetical protein